MQRLIGVRGLLVLPAFLMVGGCGWLGWDSAPANSEKARPGAERQVNVTNMLPAARGSQYDASVTPLDETRTAPRIGSVVSGKGGQKAQKEAAEKEAAERDAKAREERARAEREAALRKAQEGNKEKPAGAPADGATPGTPGPAADAAPATPAAPPAPVTTEPLPAAGTQPSDTKQ